MSVWQLVTELVGQHLIPALLASAAIYLALRLLFAVGRLRRPREQVVFLQACMLKALLALWAGASVSCLAKGVPLFGYFAVRLPSPLPDSLPLESRKLAAALTDSTLAVPVLVVVLMLAGGLLCYRWLRLAPVYRGVYATRMADPAAFRELFRVFEDLVARAYQRCHWLPRPRLMLVEEAPCPAFTMGVRPPIIVLSAALAQRLGPRELAGVLAHEIAHARRLDYLGRWFATVLRDIMIWNPFVVAWYEQLLQRQEEASDDRAAELLDDPVAVASALVEIGAYGRHHPAISMGPLAAWRMGKDVRRLNERLDRLEQRVLGLCLPRWPSCLLYSVVAVFLLAQPYVGLSLPNLLLLLMAAH